VGANRLRATAYPPQHPRQRHTGVRAQRHQRLGRARSHNAPAAGAAFGPQVDDPVALGNHVQVVLDDHHAVPGVDQAVQHVDEFFHIGHVQAHGGFVQHVQGVRYFLPAFGDVVAHLAQLRHQLDALRLATAERG
jgi:hypothetical protein